MHREEKSRKTFFFFNRYARPATGGRKVRHHNFNHDVNDAVEEVKYLCDVIRQAGTKNPTDGTMEITFGELFDVLSFPSIREIFHFIVSFFLSFSFM